MAVFFVVYSKLISISTSENIRVHFKVKINELIKSKIIWATLPEGLVKF